MAAPREVLANHAAERALIGWALVDGTAERVQGLNLQVDDFDDQRHRVTFGAMLDLAADGKAVDAFAVGEALKGRDGVKVSTADLVEIYNEAAEQAVVPQPLVDIIRQCAKRRRLALAAKQLRQAALDSTADLDAVHAEFLAQVPVDTTRTRDTGVMLVPADSIEPEAVSWAWEDRIPLGMVTLLVGVPGQGKSTLTVELAARASRGDLRGDLFGIPTTVALATAEDAIPQVVIPRLRAAGAEMGNVSIVQVQRDGIDGGISLPDDIAELGRRIVDKGVKLVVVDPLVAHIGSSVNTWKDQDVRRVLAPLAKLAADAGVAIVGVMHLNKSATSDVLNKVGGSVGFGAAARSVLFFAPDPDRPESYERILAHAKSNVGPLAPALRFRIEGREVENIETSGIVWCGQAESVTAADLVRETGTPTKNAKDDAVSEAEDVLRDLLGEGPRGADEMLKELRRLSIPERAWRAAKARLRVRSQKAGFGNGWAWVLPEGGREGGQNPLYEAGPSAFELSMRNTRRWTEEGQRPSSEELSIFADAKADEGGPKADSVHLRENPEKSAKADEGGRRRTEYSGAVHLRHGREPGEDDVTAADCAGCFHCREAEEEELARFFEQERMPEEMTTTIELLVAAMRKAA